MRILKTGYRVRVNISRQSQSERSNMAPSRPCSAGEIISHCNSRAHASRRAKVPRRSAVRFAVALPSSSTGLRL